MKRTKNLLFSWNDWWIYLICLLAMILLNGIGGAHEPISIALAFAMLMNGFSAVITCLSLLLSGLFALKESVYTFIAVATAAVFLALVFGASKKFSRTVKAEGVLYALVSLVPFVCFGFDKTYELFSAPPVLYRALFACGILFLCGVFTMGLKALLFKSLRCRLKPEETLFLAVMAVLLGLGIERTVGRGVTYAIAIFCCLFFSYTFRSYEALPFAFVAALPAALAEWSFLPIAFFTVYGMVVIFFSRENKYFSAVSGVLCYFAAEIAFAYPNFPPSFFLSTALSGVLPSVLFCLIPNSLFTKLNERMKSYRERQLPRVAINRNRALVGEQLFELSSLFRQIEGTFFSIGENSFVEECFSRARNNLHAELCSSCERKEECEKGKVFEAISSLLTVGVAKGKVSLLDLPKEITAGCKNPSDLLAEANREIKTLCRAMSENEIAEGGRLLLAEQAHGISEVLKNVALEQSRPLTAYTEREKDISEALARRGVSTSEILLYGEENNITLSLTVFGKAEVKTICEAVKSVLGVEFVLADKIPVGQNKFGYILRKRTRFDATFGVASKKKDGESVCGDTHSVIKIDERRFLIALADGSGSGEKAREVSDSTLSLLESFYRAKMPSETILSTVNRLLSFANDDSFSCIDIASVSLDTGETDLIKLGSPIGFVFTEKELKALENESLPIGTGETIHPTTVKTTLNENDVLIFMSDGVSSAFSSSTDLFDYLKDLTPLNPQKLADDLLGEALSRTGGKAEDDMTVVAVRLISTGEE